MTAPAERDGRLTIFYVADIHGSDVCFRKWLNAGRFYGADVLVIGGDLTGKVLLPDLPRAPVAMGRGPRPGADDLSTSRPAPRSTS